MDLAKITPGGIVYLKINSTESALSTFLLEKQYSLDSSFEIVSPEVVGSKAIPIDMYKNKGNKVSVYLKDKQNRILHIIAPESTYDNAFSRQNKKGEQAKSKEILGIKFEDIIEDDLRSWSSGKEVQEPLTRELIRKYNLTRGGCVKHHEHSSGSGKFRFDIDEKGNFTSTLKGEDCADLEYEDPKLGILFLSLKSKPNVKGRNIGITKVLKDDLKLKTLLETIGIPVNHFQKWLAGGGEESVPRVGGNPKELIRLSLGSGYVWAQQAKEEVRIFDVNEKTSLEIDKIDTEISFSNKTYYIGLTLKIAGFTYRCYIKFVNQTGGGGRKPNILYVDLNAI